jgi:hypothetical protein
MIHLTYTGPLAGQRLCDDRTPNGADVYNVHAMHCRNFDAPDVCPECRAVWFGDDDDDAGDDDAQASCPLCGAGDAPLLGILGNVRHYRCCDCGWTFAG